MINFIKKSTCSAQVVILAIMIGCGSTSIFASPKPDLTIQISPAKKQQCDSVQALKILLQKEFKGPEKIFQLKDKGIADSLLKGQCVLSPSQMQLLIADSLRTEQFKEKEKFGKYWEKVEKEMGYSALKDQYQSRDPDQSRIPKIYLADSSVLILPGWMVIRNRGKH